MSAEPGTDKTARREKIVMALGLVAIILFSANLLTMIARHFWPDYRIESPFAVEAQPVVTEVEAVATAESEDRRRTVHVFVNRHEQSDGAHRFVFRLNGEDFHVHARDSFRETADRIESDLRVEMERLRRDIARQQSRMESDISSRPDLQEREIDRAIDELESELGTLQRAVVTRREN